jgi:hypothetical protein
MGPFSSRFFATALSCWTLTACADVRTAPVADASTDASDAPVCNDPTLQAAISKASPCFAGTYASGPPSATLYLGYLVRLSLSCPTTGPAALQAEQAITKPAIDAIAAAACTVTSPISAMSGPVETEARAIWNAIQAACPDAAQAAPPPFKIAVDAQGKITSVTTDPPGATPPVSQALAACIVQALAGQTFSCLSGFEICPGPGTDP